MSGWEIAFAGGTCCWSAIIFLRVVAIGVDSVESAMRVLEERERRSRRTQAEQESATIDVASDASSPAA